MSSFEIGKLHSIKSGLIPYCIYIVGHLLLLFPRRSWTFGNFLKLLGCSTAPDYLYLQTQDISQIKRHHFSNLDSKNFQKKVSLQELTAKTKCKAFSKNNLPLQNICGEILIYLKIRPEKFRRQWYCDTRFGANRVNKLKILPRFFEVKNGLFRRLSS